MQPLLPDSILHVYNRANGSELLFLNEYYYLLFLNKFYVYVAKYIDLYAYALLPNHFHFCLKIKPVVELLKFEEINKLIGINEDATEFIIANFLSKQFSKMFISYTKTFNLQRGRKGSLFMKPFKRILVKDDRQLFTLINYIHDNAKRHGIVEHAEDWYYNSLHELKSKTESKIDKELVNRILNNDNLKSMPKQELLAIHNPWRLVSSA